MFDDSIGKADSSSEFHEVIVTDAMGVCFAHSLLEQTFVKGKYAWFVKLKGGVYKVIGWRKTVFPVSLYEGEVLQVCVVVKGYEVEQYDPVESSDVDQCSLYIFMYDFGTYLVAGFLVFEVLSSIIFAPAEQCSKVLLLVFAFRVKRYLNLDLSQDN